MGKLSKKKFKAGLESLFDESTDGFLQESVALVDEKEDRPKPKKVIRIKTKGSSKDFTSDLDTLLEEALAESDDNQNRQAEAAGSFELKAKKQSPIAISGLDALIRKTIDVQYVNDENEKKTKRVTISVEKKKLQKLKQIARVEKSYLKDILGSLIAEYINKYEQDNY